MSSNALPTPYPRHPPSNADYHVAIICALPRESAAVRAVFDKFWADHIEGDQITRECNDSNSYTVGEIGRHHVVLVHMPQYGTNNAATSAASLRSTFPAIKIALVVGVCGGIPIRGQEKQDIFLGDVIISKEIALYSLGHQFPDKFVSKDITAQGRTDNRDIQTYFAALDLQVLERNTVDFLKEAPRARERTTPHPKPSQPAPDTDKVFPSTHRHKHHIQSQCEICDRCNEERDPVCAESEKASCLELGCTGTVSRTWPKDTKGPGPRVHIGKVASGDTVMKSGGHRDRLVETREVIGFEMEGAGVMQIPCVIIKGVCDYADSHKNKAWQDYAAATAAACMKGFLAEYRPNAGIMQHFSMIASRTQLHGDRNLTIRGMDDNPLPVSNLGQLKMTERDERRKVLFRSLSFRGMYDRESDIPDSFKDTCQWFLKTSEYCAWTQEASPNLQDRYFNNVLWIKGNPGTGKSTLMKFLLRQRRKDIRRAESNEVLISFFFNARGHDLGKTTLGLFRSLLFQLLKSRTELQFVLDDEDDVEHHDWTVGSLKDHFKTAVEHLLETTDATLVCLIDAIDEWQETQIHEMLLFFDIQSVRFRICFASRHYPKIEIPGLHIVLETQGGHGEDIASYLNGNLSFGSAYEDKASEIRSYVKTKASGIFIWVALVVRILNDDYRSGDISPSSARDRIDNLPSSLHAFFHRILTRDQSHFDELLLCLQWVLFSEAPLTPAQLYYALHASQTEKLSSWHSKEQPDDQTIKRYILHRSKGLAQSTMSEHPTVQFIHESIPDYLLKEGGLGTIWSKLQGNIAGHSHDTLKQCCIAYTSMPGIRAYVRSGLTYLDWSSNREEALNRFPLLEYANRGVLFHANQAQSESFNQLDFMESFCHRDWASQYNIIHPRKPEDFTDYTPDASLLYILAGNGMNSLIKLRRSFQSCFEIEGGIEDIKQGEKYGVPILAATGPGSGAVIRTMLELEAVRYPDFDFARFCTRFPRGFEFPQSHHRWVFNKKEDLFEQLIRHGSEIVSLFFAETVHQASRLKLLNGQRFLAHAVSRELCDLTSTLLSKLHVQVGGAEIDGRSALHLALDRENSKLTQQLIDYGAIQALPKKVRERLLLERGSIKDVQLIKQLITLGADPDAVDDEGETRLHYAASTGNTDLAQALIDKKANVSAISQNEQKTPLHLASRKGHYEVAKILIAGRANVNASTRSGRTPLHEASLGGHSRVAKMLIDNGADIEAHATLGKEDRWTSRFPHYTSAYGGREKIVRTPLYIASSKGHTDVVTLLLERSANLENGGTGDQTPLFAASLEGQLSIVKILLQRGANIAETKRPEDSPVHAALVARKTRVAEILINHGAWVFTTDSQGKTPLHYAVKHELFRPLIKLLIARGSNQLAIDRFGETPLQLAASEPEKALFLIEEFPNINLHDTGKHGQTLLHYAAKSWHGPELIKTLLQRGLSVSARTQDNETPLHKAAWSNNIEAMELLIRDGADVCAIDCRGNTPLHSTANTGSHDSLKVVELLVNRDPLVISARNNRGETALHLAVETMKTDWAELLVSRGADTSALTENGETPLHYAARAHAGQDEIRLLLRHKVDVSARSNDGTTPLHAAIDRGHKSIAELLIKNGAEVSVTTKDRKSPLQVALSCDHHSIATMLLNYRVNISSADEKMMRECMPRGDQWIERIRRQEEFSLAFQSQKKQRLQTRTGLLSVRTQLVAIPRIQFPTLTAGAWLRQTSTIPFAKAQDSADSLVSDVE